MSSKIKSNPLNGIHTSGIYSDLSTDGPDIGTLVLVVDRAKNLPNRKTIGKQDPYCAARLGKEAKKTATDIRGGQTPKWDQELRFAVHDSPDYYQLKVSVFSDDKKTELIGETWVDLRDIVVPGGGQSDKWHQLGCRGKYAGEIRIEITYYDTRPKPEKPVSSAQSVSGSSVAGSTAASVAPAKDASSSASLSHPPGPPKRRPLPSDPITGQAPAPLPLPQPAPISAPVSAPAPPPVPAPAAAPPLPEHMQTPPRPQLGPPASATAPASAPAAYTPHQSSYSPANFNPTPPQPQHYHQVPPAAVTAAPVPASQYLDYLDRDAYAPIPVSEETMNGAYENTPPPVHQHQYQPRQPVDRPPPPVRYGSREFANDFADQQPPPPPLPPQQQQQPQFYDRSALPNPFDNAPIPVTVPPPVSSYDDPGTMPMPVDDRPPPPPAHRSRTNSSGAVESMFRSSFDSPPAKGTPPHVSMRQDVLRSEAHRLSISSAYPGRPTYRPVDSVAGSEYGGPQVSEPSSYQPSPPRHLSYDTSSAYDAQSRAAEDSQDVVGPLVPASFRKSASRMTQPPPPPPQQQQPAYDYAEPSVEAVPSPAPLHLSSRRGSSSATPGSSYAPATPSHHRRGDSSGYAISASPSPMAPRDPTRTSPNPGSQAYDSADGPFDSPRGDMDMVPVSKPYMLPPVPSSLVPGVDPGLALELRSRIQQEDQHQSRHYPPQHQAMATPPRHQMMDGPSSYSQGGSPLPYSTPQRQQIQQEPYESYEPYEPHDLQAYRTPPQPPPSSQPSHQRYDRSPTGAYSPGATSPGMAKPRGSSPNPQHTIKRKSVSPAPAPAPVSSETENGRRLSGVPFGPDSYDSLNPVVAAAKEPALPNYDQATGKIITHDGREVDPSDHLPVESWAPEPEPKLPKPGSETPSAADGTPSGGDHATPPTSGRRQLRIAGRPQPNKASSGITFSSGHDAPVVPTGRNRLQKKANRQSTSVLPMASSDLVTSQLGSSPLAPLPSPHHQDNFTPPRRLQRASTFDVANENNAAVLYTGHGRSSFSGGPAPPIPAKVPVGAGAVVGAHGGGGGSFGSSFGSSYGGGGGYGSGRYTGGAADGDRSPVMSGALPLPGGTRALPWDGGAGNAATGEMTLAEEMSRIDIGTGRARRHQGRYY